jgi:hypothetical protein
LLFFFFFYFPSSNFRMLKCCGLHILENKMIRHVVHTLTYIT